MLIFCESIKINMNTEFKIGDTVRLKSGGPKMTIASINNGVTRCQWIVNNILQEASFNVLSLKHYTFNLFIY